MTGQPEARSLPQARISRFHKAAMTMHLRPALAALFATVLVSCAVSAEGARAANTAGAAKPIVAATPAGPEAAQGPKHPTTSEVAVAAAAAPPASEAQRYCQNVAAAAADAHFALQTRKLNDIEGEIAKRVAALEAKEAEVKDVLSRHDEALKHADATLVAIYAKMRPDAAAQQISALDDATAAAVLEQLNARQASAILNEIAPDRAVKLVNTISGLVPNDGKKS